MSVLPTVSLSAVIARLRQRLDHHLLPSKRKLDDYGLESDSDSDSGDASRQLVSMLTPDPFSSSSAAASFPPLADAGSRVFPSSSSFSPSSSSTLHFFVRTMSKTLVIHASPFDTVDSVIDQIRTITGITTWEQRLIYAGRQLPGDCTLAECSLENDCCLHLTGRLRSTKFPRAWQVVNDLVASVSWLIESGYTDRLRAMRENSNIDGLVKEFLIMVLAKTVGESDDATLGQLQVFLVAGAPMMLVKLYLSAVREYRAVAERAIQLFLRSNSEFLPKSVQVRCAPIVLEFCKLLAGTVGKKDQLYLSCRSAYAMLLEAPDWRRVSQLKSVVSVIVELFPFVSEMAGTLMEGLSSESMMVATSDLNEFAKFSCALRGAIQDWMGETSPIPKLLYNAAHPRHEDWIGSLHDIYAELLKKVDQCLKKVEGFLEKKGSVQSETRWAGWSHILAILTELDSFSKIYEGAGELLHSVLLARRCPLNALIRRAKRSENLRWLLKHKDVTDFEARQNLVLMMFPDGKDDYDELHEMLIDRSQLLAESFEYIGQADASALHGRLFMEFKNEVATGPGVLREWFCLVCQAIFSPQNVLFLSCANDRRRVFPNPASAVDPLHLKYFGFCGRVIALALMHRVQVGVVFDRVFFLQLAGKGLTLEDIQNADPCLYMSCKKILEMDAELLDSDELGLTFFREYEELGTHRVVELCPGGKEIAVNSQNKEEYINLLIAHCFVTSISEQISHFAQGFSDILANSNQQKFFFQSLDLEDFDRMLGGSDSVISVREWKSHTEYNGYKARDRQICWFWKAQLEETWEALFSSIRYAKNFSGPVCFRHAILSPLGYETAMFKGLTESITCQGTPAHILLENPDIQKTARLSEFGEMLRVAFGLLGDGNLPTKPSTGHNVLFVRREDYLAHPRHSGKVQSRLSNEQEVFDAIKNWADNHKKCKINVVNGLFAHMNLKEQLRAIQEASVVIGAHGAGLTHLVAATPDTIVLEVISSLYRRPHFRLISEWKGLEYHAINLPGSFAEPAKVINELSSIMGSRGC